MNLVVMGATGSTGLEIVRQAIEMGIRSQHLCARRSDSSRFVIGSASSKEISWMLPSLNQ